MISSFSFCTTGWYSSRCPTIRTRPPASAMRISSSACGHGQHEGLLDVHVLAGEQRALAQLVVRRRRRGDRRPPAGLRPRADPRSAPWRRCAGNCVWIAAGTSRRGRRCIAAPPPGAGSSCGRGSCPSRRRPRRRCGIRSLLTVSPPPVRGSSDAFHPRRQVPVDASPPPCPRRSAAPRLLARRRASSPPPLRNGATASLDAARIAADEPVGAHRHRLHPFGLLAQRDAGLLEKHRLLLQAARVGEHDARVVDEAQHVEIADGIDDAQRLARCPAGRRRARRACAGAWGRRAASVSRAMPYELPQQRQQDLARRVRRAMDGEHAVVGAGQPERAQHAGCRAAQPRGCRAPRRT